VAAIVVLAAGTLAGSGRFAPASADALFIAR
jgi:hypothetical protein